MYRHDNVIQVITRIGGKLPIYTALVDAELQAVPLQNKLKHQKRAP